MVRACVAMSVRSFLLLLNMFRMRMMIGMS